MLGNKGSTKNFIRGVGIFIAIIFVIVLISGGGAGGLGCVLFLLAIVGIPVVGGIMIIYFIFKAIFSIGKKNNDNETLPEN